MKVIRQLVVATGVLMLVACGAERDEPFDPGSDDEDDEPRERISVRRIINDDQTLLAIDGDRQTLVFRDEDTYFTFLDRYTDLGVANEPNFETSQVVLIDLGERADDSCDYQLNLETIVAEVVNEDVGEVILEYSERQPVESEDCPDEAAENIRPFYFYSVATRRTLLISEELR
ncbi:MAG TPA: hypothetical protein VIC08_00285 [Cellvibrionaceae bacterium]